MSMRAAFWQYILCVNKFIKKKESYGSLTATTVIHISNFLSTNN